MIRLILFIIFLSFSINTKAQQELGISIGTSHLLGDFGGGVGKGSIFIKDIDFQSTTPAMGFFYRYNFLKIFAFRGQFLYGHLNGNDEFSESPQRFKRGLISKSPVYELNAQLELNLIPLKLCTHRIRFTPYLASGIGFTKVNPTISTVNKEGTPSNELQYIGDNTDQTAVFIPLTGGIKYKTRKNFILGLEASHRLVLKDNLDNYFRQEKDQYFFLTVNISYVFCYKIRKRSTIGCNPI